MKKLMLAGVALVAMAGSAFAADIIYTPPPPPPPPPPPAPVLFDWSGGYAGIYGGAYFGPGLPGTIPRFGVDVGYNFVGSGSLLFGIEAELGGAFFGGPLGLEVNVNGRLGFIVGAEDRGLIYGEGGLGWTNFAGGWAFWTLGGGIEVGVGDSASIFGEAKLARVIGFPAGGVLLQAGVNWHFN